MASLCDDTQWGPWVDGNISLCFQDIVIFGLHSLFLFIFGGWRVKELISKYHVASSDDSTVQYRLTLALNVACAALPILQIIVNFFANQVRIYETVADGYICLAWCVATVIVLLEHERGQPHDWSLRIWYLLAYMLGAIKLQALIDTKRDSWDLFFFVPGYIAQTILAIMALFFNGKASDSSYQKLGSIPSLPVEEDRAHMFQQNPLETASYWSQLIYSWLSPLMALGHQRPLQEGDLFDLVEFDTSKRQSQEFKERWKEEQQRVTPSLPRAIWRTYGFHFALAAIWKIINDALLLIGPTFLQRIISFLQGDPRQPLYVGALYALALLLTSIVQTLAIHVYWFIVFRVGMRMRAGLVTAIYRKSFKLSAEVRQKFTVGEITIDAQRLMDTVSYLHMIWSGPLQIIVSLVLLWQYIGPSVLAGVGVMVCTIPVNIFMARKLGGFQKEMLAAKDKRTKAVNEVLQGMRIIKFFAWEGSFLQKITGIREGELTILQKTNYIKAFTFFFWSSTPLLVSVCTFSVFALSGGKLTASNVFTALALFNVLRFPLNMLPQIISGLVEAKASVGRLQAFLSSDELDLNSISRIETGDDSIIIEDGEFRWREGEEPSLREINLRVARGSLVAVVGTVGAGKSSLVNALLANVRKTKGTVTVAGSVAYCSQQAWMQNASLKENILFGKPWDQRKYEETLQVCQLAPDVAMLPAGDETEIGEKGINLSGGQKQRVSIARAVYQEADIYLLDDPLSAVDAHVGKAIFKECISGILARRTRILVTHQLQYLHAVDKIVVMKGGRISEVGTYEQLMSAKGEFAALMTTHVKDLDIDDRSPSHVPAAAAAPAASATIEPVAQSGGAVIPASSTVPRIAKSQSAEGKKLIAAEEREVGSVGFGVYKGYLIALGGIWILGLLLTGYMVDQSTRVGSDWWLSVWADANFQNPNGTSTRYYLGVYLAWGVSNCIFVLGRSLLMAWASLEAARLLHNNMLKRVMRAPMSFFDTTPIGRILNRFSKDMYSVDESLPRSVGMFLSTVLNVIGAAFVISVATPWFLVAALPMAKVYNWIQRYYLDGSRELQRLDSISKSPIFAHFSETLSGVPTIRAYNLKSRFVADNERKLDANQRAYFATIAANRWLSVRLEALGTFVVFFSALFAVLNRDNINPGLAGLAITYAMSVTSTLNWMVRMSTDLETQLVAVERVSQYTTLQTEAPPVLPYRPPVNWPTEGAIQFSDLKLRYRPGLDLVLKGVSAAIKPREKIGVVGRTGAGKSSLMLALFRLVEPAEGGVQIDGEDISRLGLDDLRSRLSIIPQDPILFEGTVRSNLDPFNQYDDADLWTALESVHLKQYIGAQEKKLEHPIAESGENLSVGQRQLLCLGRALLKKAKILVMDEATAAVDFETDSLIQKTIRTEFRDRTVLTIAHRINTIIDYDRVMVLDAGRVIEFDSPQALLADQRSVFFSLAHSHSK